MFHTALEIAAIVFMFSFAALLLLIVASGIWSVFLDR